MVAVTEDKPRAAFPPERADEIHRLAKSAVGRLQGFYDEDLIQQTLIKALSSWHTYNPEKGALTTWVGAIAYSAKQDMERAAGREREKQDRFKLQIQLQVDAIRRRPGNQGMPENVKRAIASTARRFGLNACEMVRLLEDRTDIREALGLKRVPHRQTVWRALKMAV